MTINYTAAFDRIEAILRANTDPVFADVFVGEPLGLPPGGVYAAVWYAGEDEKSMTLGNVMVDEKLEVVLFFVPTPEAASRRELELAITRGNRAVQAGLRADSDLGGTVTDTQFGLASAGWREMGEFRYRSVWFDLVLVDLEAEAIVK